MKQGGLTMVSSGFTSSALRQWSYQPAAKRQVSGVARLGGRQAGFTIVETLIVLAVTGMLFLSAVVLINGRQNKTQFSTAINNLQQQLQQIVNEAASGYAPSSANYDCKKTGGRPKITPGSSGQGTNGECIFMGKMLYFGPSNATTSNFTVFSMAGNRLNASNQPVQNIIEARPVAIYRNGAGLETAYNMENGLTYAWGGSQPAGPVDYGVAFLHDLDAAAAQGQNGTNNFSTYTFSNINWGGNLNSVVNGISNSTISLSGTTQFCIASGTTSQSGLFTIDQDMHITLQIKSGLLCL